MSLYDSADLIQYRSLGYVVFRGALPTSLVHEMREQVGKAAQLARAIHGPDAQRLQPLSSYSEIDQAPFRAFAELPELREAIDAFCGPDYTYADPEGLGLFVEPAEAAWCTNWHRDLPPDSSDEQLQEVLLNPALYHQVNCALYDDSSTWYVPGSHLQPRLNLLTREVFPQTTGVSAPWPNLEGLSAVERERACLDYCQRMPGATRVQLDAGDFLLYRNSGWHLGNYVPYKQRATLHNFVWNAEYRDFIHKVQKPASERVIEPARA